MKAIPTFKFNKGEINIMIKYFEKIVNVGKWPSYLYRDNDEFLQGLKDWNDRHKTGDILSYQEVYTPLYKLGGYFKQDILSIKGVYTSPKEFDTVYKVITQLEEVKKYMFKINVYLTYTQGKRAKELANILTDYGKLIKDSYGYYLFVPEDGLIDKLYLELTDFIASHWDCPMQILSFRKDLMKAKRARIHYGLIKE